MTRTSIFRALLLLCFCVVLRLNAQVANATMNVVVQDGTGAIVPGASVTVTNNNTGQLRTGVTNDRGELPLPFLAVGQYSVTAESAGFKKTTIASVVSSGRPNGGNPHHSPTGGGA